MEEKNTIPPILTRHELAEILRVSVRTVDKLAANQTDPLPHFKIGKLVRFKTNEVFDWIRAREATTRADEIVEEMFL